MKCIIGLGNIGKEYDNTRHNLGFIALDNICAKYGVKIDKKLKKSIYSHWAGRIPDQAAGGKDSPLGRGKSQISGDDSRRKKPAGAENVPSGGDDGDETAQNLGRRFASGRPSFGKMEGTEFGWIGRTVKVLPKNCNKINILLQLWRISVMIRKINRIERMTVPCVIS